MNGAQLEPIVWTFGHRQAPDAVMNRGEPWRLLHALKTCIYGIYKKIRVLSKLLSGKPQVWAQVVANCRRYHGSFGPHAPESLGPTSLTYGGSPSSSELFSRHVDPPGHDAERFRGELSRRQKWTALLSLLQAASSHHTTCTNVRVDRTSEEAPNTDPAINCSAHGSRISQRYDRGT